MSGGMPPEGRSGSGMQALRLWRQVKRSQDDRLSTAEERRLAGRISGALWLSGGLTLLVMLPMPGERIERVWLVAAIAALGVAAGGALLAAVHWDHAPRRLFHVSTALMPVAVAILQALSGGGASPTHQYLWLVVVYAAFFFPPVPAVAYGVACSAVSAAPLLYDSGAVEANLARELLVVVPLFFIVGAIIFAGRRVLGRLSRQATALEREQRRMIDEQSSLRRVATAVAAGRRAPRAAERDGLPARADRAGDPGRRGAPRARRRVGQHRLGPRLLAAARDRRRDRRVPRARR